jgi:hypothetical protein
METPTRISLADREKNGALGPAAPSGACKSVEGLIDLFADAPGSKPRLFIESCSPDRTVAALRDVLSKSGFLYERAVPIRLALDAQQHCMVAQEITPDGLVLMAHEICRPYVVKRKPDGGVEEVNTRLPRYLAVMYLDWRGKWNLPLLNGISSTPLLTDDGTISSAQGYDPPSRIWIDGPAQLAGLVPERPTRDQAVAALALIRNVFATFCFADAETIGRVGSEPTLVDVSKPPGMDESSFLAGLMTAVCRPSLDLAPGVLLRAPPLSGAGAGKGLLARCICIIAFGREPHAVTAGANTEEVEKRIASELIGASPVLFLDNLNNTAFKSDLLASVMTERPARVRLLGRSQMVSLNTSAFVVLTGNGLSISEDLARRFVAIDLDARTEDPEVRQFKGDIRNEVMVRRSELLVAILTIWRWGRQSSDIEPGRPLGSFDRWCQWVRDPLLALGCEDPTDRVSEAKRRDGRRRDIAELFEVWWDKHRDKPVAASNLHDDVKRVADPQGRGRQFLTSHLEKLAGTRLAGFIFSRQDSPGKWSPATYKLERAGTHEHRDHREHGGGDPPMTPMTPMPLVPPAGDEIEEGMI